jgi:hypothetical protein
MHPAPTPDTTSGAGGGGVEAFPGAFDDLLAQELRGGRRGVPLAPDANRPANYRIAIIGNRIISNQASETLETDKTPLHHNDSYGVAGDLRHHEPAAVVHALRHVDKAGVIFGLWPPGRKVELPVAQCHACQRLARPVTMPGRREAQGL